MRRLAAILLPSLLAAAAPAAAQVVVPARPPLGAKLTACTVGVEPAARAATFAAQMAATKASRRMSMRFELLQRLPRGGYRPVDVPGWGTWERSEAGRPGFIYTKRVADLLAPAEYRAQVRFRWHGKGGRLLRSVQRTTKVCRQPDPRPDLVFGDLRIIRPGGQSRNASYTVMVRNDGLSAAGAFEVALTVNGLSRTTAGGPLASGSLESITFTAPRCEPRTFVVLTLDPAGVVDESREDANMLRRRCPLD